MIVTARQLEDLHRQSGSNGHLTLPYRARLSPLANDWIRSKKIVIGYGDVPMASNGTGPADSSSAPAKPQAAESVLSSNIGSFIWWCDGPCGPSKAAVVAHEKESQLRALDKPSDGKQLGSVVKSIAADVKGGRIQGAVLIVQNGALAMIFANRCPSLRAVLGTCMEAVDQAVQLAAANVLVIEHPHKTLQQVKNMLSRFTRGKRGLPEDVQRQLQELASCG